MKILTAIIHPKYILLIALAFKELVVGAQGDTLNFPPPTVPVSIYAVEAKESISVDGKLSEPSWQIAPVISDFFRMEPRQGGTYLYQTFVSILFDKNNIYFGVFCRDSVGKKGVRVQDLRRDFTSPPVLNSPVADVSPLVLLALLYWYKA